MAFISPRTSNWRIIGCSSSTRAPLQFARVFQRHRRRFRSCGFVSRVAYPEAADSVGLFGVVFLCSCLHEIAVGTSLDLSSRIAVEILVRIAMGPRVLDEHPMIRQLLVLGEIKAIEDAIDSLAV